MDKETLNQLKGLHSSEWQPALVSERVEALQELENYYARQQQRPAYTVKAFLADDLRNKGVVAHDEEVIYVNHDHLLHTELHYECINTVIHEGRHAYQVFAANSETHYDPVEEERWIINSRNLVESGEDYLKYFFQPMERDAHYYAKNEVDHLFYQLESEFGKSEYFDNYVESRDYHFQRYESQAEQRWGPDYIREVDRAIGIDEEQIQENLIERGRIEPEMEVETVQLEQEVRNFDSSTELELHAEAEAAYHERARHQERLEKLEAQYEREPSPELQEQIQDMRQEHQRLNERENETWANYMKATVEEVEEQDRFNLEYYSPSGAYISNEDRTNLAYVPVSKGQLDLNNIQWNQTKGIKLHLEKNQKGRQYIKMESKDGSVTARAYIKGEAKPFQELKNEWEMEKRTSFQKKDRSQDKELSMER